MTEPDRLGRLRSALARTAPELARALGGPLAGAATEAVARAVLGDDAMAAPPEAIEEAVRAAGPDALLALKRENNAFRVAVLEAAGAEQAIHAADRASARAREVARKDWVPGCLALVVVGGFFAVLAVMLTRRVPAGAETEFSIMLGALATMAAAVMNYYFGSSASSKEKTRLLSGLPVSRSGDTA